MCQTNVEAVATMEDGPQKVDLQATILYHRAQMLESIGKSEKALSFYHEEFHFEVSMNMARCFLYQGDLKKAESMIPACVAGQEEPKHSNWALLTQAWFIRATLE